MKKPGLLLMCLPLLLSSCTTARQRKISLGSTAVGSSKSGPKAGSSAGKSHDFGSDPTSIYEREEKQLVKNTTSIHSKSDVPTPSRQIYDDAIMTILDLNSCCMTTTAG